MEESNGAEIDQLAEKYNEATKALVASIRDLHEAAKMLEETDQSFDSIVQSIELTLEKLQLNEQRAELKKVKIEKAHPDSIQEYVKKLREVMNAFNPAQAPGNYNYNKTKKEAMEICAKELEQHMAASMGYNLENAINERLIVEYFKDVEKSINITRFFDPVSTFFRSNHYFPSVMQTVMDNILQATEYVTRQASEIEPHVQHDDYQYARYKNFRDRMALLQSNLLNCLERAKSLQNGLDVEYKDELEQGSGLAEAIIKKMSETESSAEISPMTSDTSISSEESSEKNKWQRATPTQQQRIRTTKRVNWMDEIIGEIKMEDPLLESKVHTIKSIRDLKDLGPESKVRWVAAVVSAREPADLEQVINSVLQKPEVKATAQRRSIFQRFDSASPLKSIKDSLAKVGSKFKKP